MEKCTHKTWRGRIIDNNKHVICNCCGKTYINDIYSKSQTLINSTKNASHSQGGDKII